MRQLAVLSPLVNAPAFAATFPHDGAKVAAGLQPWRPAWQVHTFHVAQGEWPAEPLAFDGVVITGSPASVNDGDAWIGRLEQLVRALYGAGLPLVGICFGHQLIHKALGGRVVLQPSGLRVGTVTTRLQALAPWMQPAAPEITLYAAHEDQVLQPAPGAQVLGGDAVCPVACTAIGRQVFTTQCHPEFDPAFMNALLPALAGHLRPKALAAGQAQLQQGPAQSALMMRWIAQFFDQAWAARGAAPPRLLPPNQ